MGALFSSKKILKEESVEVYPFDDLLNRISKLEKKYKTTSNKNKLLQEKIQDIEQKADVDHDGVVTKEEMRTYMLSQLESRENELIDMKNELIRERTENDQIKEKYELLKAKYLEKHPSSIKVSKVDKKIVKRYVDDLLADPETNWKMVPDIIEKPMRVEEYEAMLKLLEKIFCSLTIDIAGHRVQGVISPISE
jgi:Ca2+-binding EF-hand superfamily protein